jgi:hypothetical protein
MKVILTDVFNSHLLIPFLFSLLQSPPILDSPRQSFILSHAIYDRYCALRVFNIILGYFGVEQQLRKTESFRFFMFFFVIMWDFNLKTRLKVATYFVSRVVGLSLDISQISVKVFFTNML